MKKGILEEIIEKSTDMILKEENLDEDEALRIIENVVFSYQDLVDYRDISGTINRVHGTLRGPLGALSYLLHDDEISEIMINGVKDIYIEKDGIMKKVEDSFDSRDELKQMIRRIGARVRRDINEMNPILDARLEDGSRVNAVLENVALDGPAITIRRFGYKRISPEDLVNGGTITDEAMELLKTLVASGYNIFVSGSTSSGKTTFLNALSEFIPGTERVVTIEDSCELKMDRIPNLVRLECRNAMDSYGRGGVTLDMLLRTSLRMRPDRIIVGEVRGKEVSDMLQALNTGHSGMSTGHGNSIKGMLRRLEAMYISGSDMPMDSVRAQVVEGIDIMVQLGRLKDGRRKVLEISELCGYNGMEYVLNDLFVMNEELNLVPTGNNIVNNMKLKLRGIG